MAEQKANEHAAVPLLQGGMGDIKGNGPSPPAVLMPDDLFFGVELDYYCRRKRKAHRRHYAQRVGRLLFKARLSGYDCEVAFTGVANCILAEYERAAHRPHRWWVEAPGGGGFSIHVEDFVDQIETSDNAARRPDRSAGIVEYRGIVIDGS
eukprot:CAMPEP_0185776466 /NCGR_PEP_ID=MMETSP1174-20130828/85759_1 /TAXON_ID=35687 /ORGANISM="Dictyocha speculum, Strain CCMP1381" /LENGTH=150 /DNA_ID=CAMNT_0028464427 /DNA_START=269 /DNA_END=722 /DNA_ORIENTATION=+